LNLVLPKGADGADGTPNTLTIGTVTSGVTASASITGESPSQVLNLVLPKGADGEDGTSIIIVADKDAALTASTADPGGWYAWPED
jgi:hypothetical protein